MKLWVQDASGEFVFNKRKRF